MPSKRISPFLLEMGVNVLLPYLVYDWLSPSVGNTQALIISAIPPIIWSLVQIIREKRIDAISIFVIAGIALSLLAMAGGGSARLLQIRENLVNALIGLVFLGSVLIKRPLIVVLARAQIKARNPEHIDQFNLAMKHPQKRRPLILMTLVWGAGLILSALLSCALVFMMSIGTYMIVSPVVGYGVYGILILWTVWYSKRLKMR